MKKLKIPFLLTAVAAFSLVAGSASAGTLQVTSGPTYDPPGAFSNSTIQVQSLRPETVRISGDTTVTPTPSSTASITVTGNFSASSGDRASGAYSFVIDSNVTFPVQYELRGTATAAGQTLNFGTQGTVLPGLNQYRGQFQAPSTFPFSAGGTFTGSLRLISGAASASASAGKEAAAPGTLEVSITQFDFQLAPAAVTPIPTAQLLNISTRLGVQTGENVLIAGFIVAGDEAKRVMIRGIGPSITARGVAGALQDPVLELNYGAIIKDNWKEGGQQADIEASGIAPTDDREAALIVTLQPGAHSAVMRGANNTTGVGLIEVYDLSQATPARLANISSRGFVQTGNEVMIGGFILGPEANSATTVVVRAIGPSLGSRGVANPLANPTLELRDAQGALIVSNDDWRQGSDSDTIAARGLAPENDLESAVLAIPSPGNYTAIVSGVNNTTGVGLVEVYHLQ